MKKSCPKGQPFFCDHTGRVCFFALVRKTQKFSQLLQSCQVAVFVIRVPRHLAEHGDLLGQRRGEQQHPNAVVRVRIDGNVLDDKIASTAVVFIVAYFLALLAGTVVGTMCGVDMETSFSSAVACMGNVGPGFGMVGSLGNYSDLPAVMKFSNTMLMLLGRLEIFGLVQLFFLKWWR